MDKITQLFTSYTGKAPTLCRQLTAAGSPRRYFRLQADGIALIGTVGESAEENAAFIALSKHLEGCGLPVPHVCAVGNDNLCYLQTDLGDLSLYDFLLPCRQSGMWDEKSRHMLSTTLRLLARMQVLGDRGLDYSRCYPLPEMNDRAIMFDLNYFKYCFLKATGVSFNENKLQDDFERLSHQLLNASPQGFMYRDFQSRNIMINDGKPWFIDFQGGRHGTVHYDVASFLWQARAQYPADLRNELIDEYIDELRRLLPQTDAAAFKEQLRLFVLFRALQVLGAYGFRGYFERKELFLQSIPPAIANLREMVQNGFSDEYPHLSDILRTICNLPQFLPTAPLSTLCVTIYSFSYKKGLPTDDSGNGGGFIFDCRAIHNPGRYPEYASLTGRDKAVKEFLEKGGEIQPFLSHACALVDATVERYIKRGFTRLQVAFGCTGGQHRSVYSAQALAEHLHDKYNIDIHLIHREQNIEQHLSPRPKL